MKHLRQIGPLQLISLIAGIIGIGMFIRFLVIPDSQKLVLENMTSINHKLDSIVSKVQELSIAIDHMNDKKQLEIAMSELKTISEELTALKEILKDKGYSGSDLSHKLESTQNLIKQIEHKVKLKVVGLVNSQGEYEGHFEPSSQADAVRGSSDNTVATRRPELEGHVARDIPKSQGNSAPPGVHVDEGNNFIWWDHPANLNSDDIAGFNVYYGTEPRTGTCPAGGYTNAKNVGNEYNFKPSNLNRGMRYYFSVTAYEISGNESCFIDAERTFIFDK